MADKNYYQKLSMLVSGRIHGAVAALSQSVPTVIIDYGHEPKAHKLIGFAKVVGVQDFVADPCVFSDLKLKLIGAITKDDYKNTSTIKFLKYKP